MMKKRNPKMKKVSEYDIFLNKELGKGAFGSVYEGYNTLKNEKIAVKMVERTNINTKNDLYLLNAFIRQTLILSKISSENVVSFKDIIATKSYFYIIQQKCDGDLRAYLNFHPKGIAESKAIHFITDMLNGFYSLIVTNVIHRDIKPENILFKNGRLKLADFGLARRVSEYQPVKSSVGTKNYSSPQIFCNQQYTTKCDIWSLGLVFYELLYGSKLLKVPDTQLFKQMQSFQEGINFPMQPQVSQDCKQIIRACLRFREQDRADWNYLFSHPLFVKHVPSLKRLNMSLNYILSIIRQEIDSKNIDLAKFFKRFGLGTGSELTFQQYARIILKLVDYCKVTPEEIRFSFNYFDRDKSGKVSFQQFKQTLQEYGIQMNAATRDQIISRLVTSIQEKNQQGETINSHDESFTQQELLRYHNTEKAYQNMLRVMESTKALNIAQKFKQMNGPKIGLNLDQFKKFIQQKLQIPITNDQCELIFNKFDDDKNNLLDFEEFEKYVCKQINIPTSSSFLQSAHSL